MGGGSRILCLVRWEGGGRILCLVRWEGGGRILFSKIILFFLLLLLLLLVRQMETPVSSMKVAAHLRSSRLLWSL